MIQTVLLIHVHLIHDHLIQKREHHKRKKDGMNHL
jgi:hypothetical protein